MIETFVQIAAAFGPVLLAIMGVIVSLSPPDRIGRAHKVWAASFVVVGAFSALAIFFELRGTDKILGQIWEHLQGPQSGDRPQGPNKYVCVKGDRLGDGKYAMLVEFGVLRQATNGQTVGVRTNSEYSSVDYWFAPPLRTDITPFSGGKGILMSASENKTRAAYASTITFPSINPKTSFYVKFEAPTPLAIAEQIFVEDAQITWASDPSEFMRLIKEPFGPCPRSRN
jgi:hypothetical protein